MPFSRQVREEALVRSKRCCCVCQEFSGRSTNVHHVKPESEGGDSTINNAIVLCLRCHGEAGHYNPNHPIGNSYSCNELVRHRDSWWAWCSANPATIPPKFPILIRPSMIKLQRTAWSRTVSVSIRNQSNEPLFEVWIQAMVLGPADLKSSLEMGARVQKAHPTARLPGLQVHTDAIGFDGIDAAGRPSTLIRFYGIDPGETVNLDVRLHARPSSADDAGELRFEVLQFSEEPPPILENLAFGEAAVAFPLEWPVEGFQIHRSGLRLRTL